MGLLMLTVYLVILANEGNNSIGEILPWVFVMAIPTVAVFASGMTAKRRIAGNLAITATILFAGVGLLALASIGFGFLIAASMSMLAVIRLVEADSA